MTGAVEPESAHIVNKLLVSIKLSNKKYISYVYSNTNNFGGRGFSV
jgi:hypothetical protein